MYQESCCGAKCLNFHRFAKKLPRFEMITELKCIEGWSIITHWAGARMADFIARYPPTTRSGAAPWSKER